MAHGGVHGPGNSPGARNTNGGGDNASFTMDGFPRELRAGDVISDEEAEQIVAASGGMLRIEGNRIVGHNPDGSGDVSIEIGKPLSSGQIHDLHHTVAGSGGTGNSNNQGGGHH